MCNYRQFFCSALLVTMMLLGTGLAAAAVVVPRMSTDELKSRLGEPGLVILDVRASWDWADAKDKIIGADRAEPNEISQWVNQYAREETLVLYCS